MKVQDKTSFRSGGFYNVTAQIQENTVLNRGLIDLGGCAVPQMIMSNNKDERIERGVIQGLYFATSFMAPFVLLPLFNKTFLAKNKIVKNFASNEGKIIEVSKKYLTKDAEFLVKGIRETAHKLENESIKNGKPIKVKEDFENILSRFKDKDELKNKLLKTHENVLFSDFLATALMWCATPWAGMEVTKLRTKRSGFSATYGMIDENQSKQNAKKYEQEKKKKLLTSALIGIIPSVIFPKLVTQGFKNKSGILSNIIKKMPESLNYGKGMFPSKLIFAAIWILCDYPSQIISSRDKYERRDRAIRGVGAITVFFGGDFVLNNIFGRMSDKFLGTKIMDRAKINENSGFFKKMSIQPKSFEDLKNVKGLAQKAMTKTKNVGAALYWASLITNMGILGFAMPSILNKVLKNTVKKDLIQQENSQIKS